MTGSTFGKSFSITTFGESHGSAVGVVVQGCPPRLPLTEEMIQRALDLRRPGVGPASTSRKEPDRPVIMSGVFNRMTTGTPVMIMIENRDADSEAYSKNAAVFRPGHGDFTYQAKYGIRDFRGGGRASARETAARVAAGAVAQAFLDRYGVEVAAYTIELGGIAIETFDMATAAGNSLLCPDANAAAKMAERIAQVRKEGDSLGGIVEIRATGVPAGLGEPVFDKLDADIARALMSIGAVKAVEIGAGFKAARMKGSENNDELRRDGFLTNNAGGVLAGISNGETVVARAHIKPIPSVRKQLRTIDENGNETEISTSGRHDISAIPRINQVCSAMTALTIADHMLRQKAVI